MRRLRLVKVLVQPVVMLDDGETLTEIPMGAVEVSAADWPGYAAGRFADEMAALEQQANAGPVDIFSDEVRVTEDEA